MNTNENKGLIWNLLQSHGHFNKVDSTKFNEIQGEFELIVNNIAKQNTNESILELNKKVIATFIKVLEKYKKESQPISNNEIQQERLDLFNSEYEKRQKEFDSYMKKDPPKEVDFADAVDEPFKEDVGTIVENMVSSREKQLQHILEQQPPVLPEQVINADTKSKKMSKQNKLLEKIIANQEIMIKLLEKNNN